MSEASSQFAGSQTRDVPARYVVSSINLTTSSWTTLSPAGCRKVTHAPHEPLPQYVGVCRSKPNDSDSIKCSTTWRLQCESLLYKYNIMATTRYSAVHCVLGVPVFACVASFHDMDLEHNVGLSLVSGSNLQMSFMRSPQAEVPS